MATETLNKLANAKASAKASFESIKEMVEALRKARSEDESSTLDTDLIEQAETAIREHPLSIEVRRGWHVLGEEADPTPAEYRILISTGGPAVQITGTLNEYAEPESADLECQDWFQPWTRVSWQELDYTFEELQNLEEANHPRTILLEYAQSFYFGE